MEDGHDPELAERQAESLETQGSSAAKK